MACRRVQGAFEWNWLHAKHLWFVTPAGLGRRLIEAVENLASERGQVWPFPRHDGVPRRGPFHEKLGFSFIGRLDSAAAPNAHFFVAEALR